MSSTQVTEFQISTDPSAWVISAVSVCKDANDRYRWLAVSSTAFKDRDGQIVSTKALEQDVSRTDAGASPGPLRFWHVPGLDIGDCDYSAMSGRTLIESGTFRDERYGQMIKDSPQSWGISLGFLHPLSEPDNNGVFNNIQRFERSLVPAGKASNLFTRLVVKEVQMLTDEKRAALKALINDDGLLNQLLSNVQQTEKQADQAGVAFKDETPVTPAPDIAALINTSITAALVPVLTALQGIGQAQAQVATKEQALSTSVTEHGTMIATLKAQIEASSAEQAKLKTALTELLGDQPAANGYRASTANDNIVNKDHQASAEVKPVNFAQFFGFGQQ